MKINRPVSSVSSSAVSSLLVNSHLKRSGESAEEPLYASLPLLRRAHVVLRPGRTEIVSVAVATIVAKYTKGMTAMAACLDGAVGEEGGNIERRLVDAGLVGGVGIVDVVWAEDDGLRSFTLDDDTRTETDGMVEPLVPDGHAVEVRLLVELNDAVLLNLAAVDPRLVLHQMDGEAQRTVVENLIAVEDVGHHDAVADHQCRSATA